MSFCGCIIFISSEMQEVGTSVQSRRSNSNCRYTLTAMNLECIWKSSLLSLSALLDCKLKYDSFIRRDIDLQSSLYLLNMVILVFSVKYTERVSMVFLVIVLHIHKGV